MMGVGKGFINGASHSLEMSGLITIRGSELCRGASVVHPTWHGGCEEWGPHPQPVHTITVAGDTIHSETWTKILHLKHSEIVVNDHARRQFDYRIKRCHGFLPTVVSTFYIWRNQTNEPFLIIE